MLSLSSMVPFILEAFSIANSTKLLQELSESLKESEGGYLLFAYGVRAEHVRLLFELSQVEKRLALGKISLRLISLLFEFSWFPGGLLWDFL